MSSKIPLSRPHFSERDLRDAFGIMRRSVRDGWLTSGPVTETFERQFAAYVGTKHAVAVNSGTAALHAIALALHIRKDDEVILPANTFVATANAVLFAGGTPVLVDSDPSSFNLSIPAVRKAITPRTKAIICVHLAGNPCDMDSLREIASENDLQLVEDAAHAHGATYKGKKAGSLGAVAAFSFYPTKLITTGEGGMVTTDSERIANEVRALRNHGRYGFGPKEVTRLGYNFRMSDINAALGVVQLRHLDRFVQHRNTVAEVYKEAFAAEDRVGIQRVEEHSISSYYSYLVKVPDRPGVRDGVMTKLGKDGIETSVMYKPIHWQPYFSRLRPKGGWYLPVADMLGNCGLALPMFDGLTRAETQHVASRLLGGLT